MATRFRRLDLVGVELRPWTSVSPKTKKTVAPVVVMAAASR